MSTMKRLEQLESAHREAGRLSEDLENLTALIADHRGALDRFTAMMPEQAQAALFEALRASRKAVRLVTTQLEVEFSDD